MEWWERIGLTLGAVMGHYLPSLVVPPIVARLRHETESLILPGEDADLRRYLAERRADGIRLNLNQLGEAILGEEEAARRLEAYLALLARDDVEYISVKVSSVSSQLELSAFRPAVEVVKDRLRALYRQALAHHYQHPDGRVTPKFVNLDMEEYRDLDLTVTAFQEVLDENEFIVLPAGIVLQAYLPESHRVQRGLVTWAVARRARGGAPIKLRVVKGANLAMERIEADLHGWPQAPFARKVEVDANFKRMIEYGCRPEHARAVHLGIASHNLFDVAHGLVLREERGVEEWVEFEMLEGMANREWIDRIRAEWRARPVEPVPLQVGGTLVVGAARVDGRDRSPPGRVAYRHALADRAQVGHALDAARAAQPAWGGRPAAERRRLLDAAGAVLARRRGDLVGAMIVDGAKTVPRADPEVSEAIDFARYYARALGAGDEVDGARMEPLGVVVVAPPWNCRLSIPAGGVLAALAAGNAVLLKPAPEAVLVGWHLAQALWAAGVPRDALQFVPCPDDEVGRGLITDPRVDAVILTGSVETARRFLDWRPDLHLFAETSGKNAIIVTALSDRDQAIRDLVRSAFGHDGQKCSAASLAICLAEVYDDPAFRRQLRDATESLTVGRAWDEASRITPLTQPPGEALRRALTTLDPGEEWLLEPRALSEAPPLWSPGIKLGVRPGSFFHLTECFGPVLGLMRAADLDEAIPPLNTVPLGLTSG